MTAGVFAFYLFASVLLSAGVMVIMARNPVHSVLWLIVCFFNAAGLFILLGAEFLAMTLLIVYVGAVAVLFLFVVMMLDVDFATLRSGLARYLPLGLLVAGVILAEILLAVGSWRAGDTVQMFDVLAGTPEGMSNTQWIGSVLYTRYLFVFQAAGLVLLVSMIGAIVLTHRQRVGTKRQDIGKQVAMTPAKAVRKAQPGVGQGVEL
nr:NADH-quinone oxidoreductase subunit J [Polymorphobacter sp.]